MATRLISRSLHRGSPLLGTALRTCEIPRTPLWARTSFRLSPAVNTDKQHGNSFRLSPAVNTDKQQDCLQVAQPQVMHAAAPSVFAVLPVGMAAALPACLVPGTHADVPWRWLFESVIDMGTFTLGLQGILSVFMLASPVVEVVPRIIREGDVGKLPLLPYSAMLVQGFCYSCYGILLGNPAIYTQNIFAVVAGSVSMGVYLRYCPAGANWLPHTKGFHIVGVTAATAFCSGVSLLLPLSSATAILGSSAIAFTLVMQAGPLAATRTVIKEKCTRSLPFGFTAFLFVSCSAWVYYAYYILDDPYLYIQSAIGITLSFLQLCLFARYGFYRPQSK